jgi:hypothetical protein
MIEVGKCGTNDPQKADGPYFRNIQKVQRSKRFSKANQALQRELAWVRVDHDLEVMKRASKKL